MVHFLLVFFFWSIFSPQLPGGEIRAALEFRRFCSAPLLCYSRAGRHFFCFVCNITGFVACAFPFINVYWCSRKRGGDKVSVRGWPRTEWLCLLCARRAAQLWYPVDCFFPQHLQYDIPTGVNGVVEVNLSLSVHRNLISAPGAFGDDFTADSRQLKGFRFLSKSGFTHPNWDLWAEKWRRLKKTRMLPRVRCVLCASLSLKSHFYATTLSFILFVLLRSACEVRLKTMAALDCEPFPSMVHVVIACWGASSTCTCSTGLESRALIETRETRQCLCCIDRSKDNGDEIMAGISSCHWHPV